MTGLIDLVERYVSAVGRYLPEEQRLDVMAELRANLLEEIDSRGDERGGPLTESDVADVLLHHGKPEVVALRYLPQRSLIGPSVYPFYKLTVLRILPLIVLACVVAQGLDFATGHVSLPAALGHLASSLAISAMVSVGIMTVVFALIDRARERGQLGKKFTEWDPMKLPPVSHPTPSDSARMMAKKLLDLTLHCVWFAYVLWVPLHPFWIMGPGVFTLRRMDVALAPVWHTFYVALILLLSVQLVIKLAAFLPGDNRWVMQGKVASRVLGLVVLAIFYKTSTYFVPAAPGGDLVTLAHVNHGVSLALKIVFFVAVFGAYKDVAKLWQGRRVSQMAL